MLEPPESERRNAATRFSRRSFLQRGVKASALLPYAHPFMSQGANARDGPAQPATRHQGPSQPMRYDGSACLNVRHVTAAMQILSDEQSSKPITRKELATALWFVDVCAMSNNMFFDATVPKDTVAQTTESIDSFQRRYSLPAARVRPLTAGTDEQILAAATEAATEAFPLFDKFQLDSSVDEPVTESEATEFVRILGEESSSEQSRRAQALELVTEANRIRGSKCLAGVLNANARVRIAVRRAYQDNRGKARELTGAMINRFRLNFLNHLASLQKAAYVPNPSFEGLTRQHVRLFSDYLLKKVAEDLGERPDPTALAGSLKQEAAYPPIGLYALMTTKAQRRPAAILEKAIATYREREDLRRLIWGVTETGIKLKGRHSDLDEYHRAVDELFAGQYGRLHRDAKDIKAAVVDSRRLSRYVVPMAIGPLAGLVPAPGGVAFTRAVYESVVVIGAATTATSLCDDLIARNVNSYLSQYQSLNWDLRDDPAMQQPLTRIATQVERIFGRPLA